MQKRINLVDIERIQSKTNLKQLSCEKSALDLPKFGSPPTQINSYADAGDRTFGAKMPTPFFFIASAFFFAEADFAFLPAVRLMAVSFFNVAFVGLVVFTFFRGSVFFLFLFFSFSSSSPWQVEGANNPLRKPTTCRSASARRRIQRVFCKSIVRTTIVRQFFKTNGMSQSG